MTERLSIGDCPLCGVEVMEADEHICKPVEGATGAREPAAHVAEVDRLTKEVEHYTHQSHEWAKKSVKWLSKLVAAEQRISELTSANEHLVEREKYFAEKLGVADGGLYRADWDAKLSNIMAANEKKAKNIARALWDSELHDSMRSEVWKGQAEKIVLAILNGGVIQ